MKKYIQPYCVREQDMPNLYRIYFGLRIKDFTKPFIRQCNLYPLASGVDIQKTVKISLVR